MTRFARTRVNTSLWTAQVALAVTFAQAGLLKAFVPAADLQERLGFMVEAHAGILRPVGLVEMVLALALIVPAGARVLPKATPFAASWLGAIALLGMFQPSSAGGLGLVIPNLALVAGAAFIAWGRLVAVPIEPATFGPEVEAGAGEAAARLERNRQRQAARIAGTRSVA